MSEQRVCLVHYHEIGLKGKNRAHFEKQLITNIKAVLGDAPVARIKRISGRICLFEEEGATYEQSCELVDLIAGIPGVARVSCGYRCEQDLEVMYETAIKALSDVPSFETFKVQARRNHTDFEIDSMQLNQLVGAVLCRSFQDKKVLMKNPDVEVRVEVIQGHCYIYAHSVQGVGGLPVGSAGKVVTLMSSGIDSPVQRGASRVVVRCLWVFISLVGQRRSIRASIWSTISHTCSSARAASHDSMWCRSENTSAGSLSFRPLPCASCSTVASCI